MAIQNNTPKSLLKIYQDIQVNMVKKHFKGLSLHIFNCLTQSSLKVL